MKKELIFILLLLLMSSLSADEFIVKSFLPIPNDITARRNAQYDINGDACALIKVKTDIKKAIIFDSNMGIPIAPVLKQKGEYWVYVAEGERALKCMADGFIPKNIPLEGVGKITSFSTYELVLSSKEKNIEILPVTILSEPEDAEKWIDGAFLGKGKSFELSLGKHELGIQKVGYRSIVKTINVSKSSTFFDKNKLKQIDIVPVKIRSLPQGASVYINDMLQDKKTDLPIFLYPGNYDIRLSLSGYLEKTLSIRVQEEGDNDFKSVLERNTGSLNINIQPEDASCFINKTLYHATKNIQLAPASYKIEVSCDGYESFEEIITINRGDIIDREYQLVRKTGILQFSIVPLDAQVQMRDMKGRVVKSWKGMKYDKSVPAGNYRLQCSHTDYKSKYTNLSIIENQKSEIEVLLEAINSQSAEQQNNNIYNDQLKELKNFDTKRNDYQISGVGGKSTSSNEKSTKKDRKKEEGIIFVDVGLGMMSGTEYNHLLGYGSFGGISKYGNFSLRTYIYKDTLVVNGSNSFRFKPVTPLLLKYETPMNYRSEIYFTADIGAGLSLGKQEQFCWEIGASLYSNVSLSLRVFYSQLQRQKEYVSGTTNNKEYEKINYFGTTVGVWLPIMTFMY